MTKFKTNIKCSACVEKVTPYLNEVVGASNWQVDLTDPGRVLTITNQVPDVKVIESLKKAGYKGEVLG